MKSTVVTDEAVEQEETFPCLMMHESNGVTLVTGRKDAFFVGVVVAPRRLGYYGAMFSPRMMKPFKGRVVLEG